MPAGWGMEFSVSALLSKHVYPEPAHWPVLALLVLFVEFCLSLSVLHTASYITGTRAQNTVTLLTVPYKGRKSDGQETKS